MEEMHRTHKETVWGWVSVLSDWRRSWTRRRLHTPAFAAPASHSWRTGKGDAMASVMPRSSRPPL